VDPGFAHFGFGELVAISLAVSIIMDWALHRYG